MSLSQRSPVRGRTATSLRFLHLALSEVGTAFPCFFKRNRLFRGIFFLKEESPFPRHLVCAFNRPHVRRGGGGFAELSSSDCCSFKEVAPGVRNGCRKLVILEKYMYQLSPLKMGFVVRIELPSRRFPQPRSFIVRACRQCEPIGAPRDACDASTVPFERCPACPARHVP
jgi:hypothetical protein